MPFAEESGASLDAVNRLIKRIGTRPLRLSGQQIAVSWYSPFPSITRPHLHCLRHACGYALANAGHDTRRIQDWLGHRSIQHTTRYTQLSAAPFKDFWQ
jgi:site-specific recombinase XerD